MKRIVFKNHFDFYRIDGKETITDTGEEVNRIDSERVGQLIRGSN